MTQQDRLYAVAFAEVYTANRLDVGKTAETLGWRESEVRHYLATPAVQEQLARCYAVLQAGASANIQRVVGELLFRMQDVSDDRTALDYAKTIADMMADAARTTVTNRTDASPGLSITYALLEP